MKEWTPEEGWNECYKNGTNKILICALISTISAFFSVLIPISSFLTLPINIICIILIPILHIIYANRYLLTPAYKQLSPARRIFLRWGSRIAFVQLITYVYTPSVFWIAIITCPLGFLAFTKIQEKIISWQLEREEKGLDLTIIEKLALGILLFISAAIFFVAVACAAALGCIIQWAISLFPST